MRWGHTSGGLGTLDLIRSGRGNQLTDVMHPVAITNGTITSTARLLFIKFVEH